MKKMISKKALWLVGIAVVIAILAAVTVAASDGNSSFAQTLSHPFFRPIRGAMTSLVDTLEDLYDYMYRFDAIKAENESLKQQVAQLKEEYRTYTEISQENERLRKLLEFSERNQELKKEPVSVISWSASNYASSFTISKGSLNGVELYDPVINEYGYLVGQVTEVTAGTSTVTTVIDTRMSIGTLIYETGDTGVMQGDFVLMQNEQAKLHYLGEINHVSIGSTVVTSGSSGYFPRGLIIGTVTSLASGSSGLDEYAVVQAAAEIASSTHLYVITDFSVSE